MLRSRRKDMMRGVTLAILFAVVTPACCKDTEAKWGENGNKLFDRMRNGLRLHCLRLDRTTLGKPGQRIFVPGVQPAVPSSGSIVSGGGLYSGRQNIRTGAFGGVYHSVHGPASNGISHRFVRTYIKRIESPSSALSAMFRLLSKRAATAEGAEVVSGAPKRQRSVEDILHNRVPQEEKNENSTRSGTKTKQSWNKFAAADDKFKKIMLEEGSSVNRAWHSPPQEREGVVEDVHSEQDLDVCLQRHPGLVVLKVMGTGCRACKAFIPKYKRFAKNYRKVKFLWVLGNENNSTLRLVRDRLKVKATPSFYFFRNGERVNDLRGAKEPIFRSTLENCTLLEEKPEDKESESHDDY